MEKLQDIVSMIDSTLDTKRKRHIIGGILLGASIFFGVLAITAVSIKEGERL